MADRQTVLAAGLAAALMASGAGADPLGGQDRRDAATALTMHYLAEGIYRPVRCRTGVHDNATYIMCAAIGGDGSVGGLWRAGAGPAGLSLFAVNGKAAQHMRGRPEAVTDRGRAFPLARWAGPGVDIAGAMASTR